jgi:two-component sensor histidine kinase
MRTKPERRRATAAPPPSADERVLVLAPFGRDAAVLARALAGAGHGAEVCPHDDDDAAGALGRRLAEGAGCLVVTEEALAPPVVAALAGFLRAQPPWSDLPVIALLDRPGGRDAGGTDALRAACPDANVTVLVRPVRAVTLLSSVAAALRARRRQYEVRDHLQRQARREEAQRRLVRELNHRVKNILATVMSIAAQTLHQSDSLDAFHESFEGRVQSLARVHEALARNAWRATTLREIAELALAPYADGVGGRLDLAGSGVRLSAEAGLSLGMYLHELATNAAKYGALSAPGGRVRLEWREADGGSGGGGGRRLIVRWAEEGGPAVRRPTRLGFGTRLIERGVAYELDGRAELDYRETGLVCTLDIPLEGVAAADPGRSADVATR